MGQKKKIKVSLDWGKFEPLPPLEHDDSFNKRIVKMANDFERSVFSYMLFHHLNKIYYWTDTVSSGVMVRFEMKFDKVRPKDTMCAELDFQHLLDMDSIDFMKLPDDGNKDIVSMWRMEMIKDVRPPMEKTSWFLKPQGLMIF